MLRSATGLATPRWIVLASGRYRLDPGLIGTDLWRFQAPWKRAGTPPATRRGWPAAAKRPR